jgi:hypothetical protein
MMWRKKDFIYRESRLGSTAKCGAVIATNRVPSSRVSSKLCAIKSRAIKPCAIEPVSSSRVSSSRVPSRHLPSRRIRFRIPPFLAGRSGWSVGRVAARCRSRVGLTKVE